MKISFDRKVRIVQSNDTVSQGELNLDGTYYDALESNISNNRSGSSLGLFGNQDDDGVFYMDSFESNDAVEDSSGLSFETSGTGSCIYEDNDESDDLISRVLQKVQQMWDETEDELKVIRHSLSQPSTGMPTIVGSGNTELYVFGRDCFLIHFP